MHCRTKNKIKKMSKTLPIQQVHFRGERDQFLTEGGGGSRLPKWVNEENIRANILRVNAHIAELEHAFEKRDETSLPILTIVDINKEATAKSHRFAIHSMVDVNKKRNVLGTTDIGKLLVKIDTRADLKAIAEKFNPENKNLSKNLQKGLAAVADITKYVPITDTSIESAEVLKVQLVDYLNSEMNLRSKRLLLNFCNKNNVEVEELNYASELRLFKLKNISRENAGELVGMDGVLSVRKMPTIEFQAAPEPEDSEIEIMLPKDGQDYPIVGLLDSGVTDIGYMRPWLLKEENVADNSIYETVEQMPEYPSGGTAGLMNFISKNLKYPTICQESGVQGRVVVSFVVNKDGSTTDFRIIRSVDKYLDKEALRVLNGMPKWKPGKQKGVPVRVRYTVPINFKLS